MSDMLYIGNREEEAYFFYRPNEPYGCFSNWYKSPFTVNGIRFNTAEQYIMYQKCIIFGDKEAAADVLAANSPREQKAIGRRARGYIPKVWEGIRQMVAVKGLYAKFSQNEDLKKIQTTEYGPADYPLTIITAFMRTDGMDRTFSALPLWR